MRALRPWLVCLALAPAALADAPAPADSLLDSCAQSRAPTGHPLEGLDQLEAQCPGLTQALSNLGITEQLGEEWRARLNLGAIGRLAEIRRFYQGDPHYQAPRLQTLAAVASALQVREAPRSWWQRFLAWLRSLVRQDEVPDRSNLGWLDRLLAQLDLKPSLARAIGYATMAVVIALALWIVWRELRQANVFSRRRRTESGATIARAAWEPPQSAAKLRADDLDRLPLWERPAALLQLLVQALRQTERLGLERALTYRELAERAKLDDEFQRRRFERIALLAERQRYAARTEPPAVGADAELNETLTDGLSLYTQIRGAASARP